MFISAVMLTTPEMFPAFGCAPDIPPRPAVTKSMPLRSFCPGFIRLRAAFMTVIVVPCTMPCGPMYIYEPAVIWPYCETPIALKRSQSSCDEWLGMTMPFVTITRGASLCEGKSPRGCPEYITRVCSSVISARYFIARRYCAQFWNTAPLPPYVMSSCGCCATALSRLFCIISIMAAAWRERAGYSSIGRAYISYSGRKRYMYMRPYLFNSSRNSGASSAWCFSGK